MKTFKPGDIVNVAITEPGGGKPRLAGTILGIVLHAGGEYDVIIHPAEEMEEVADVLHRCDMALEDVREGPVYVLRNCQPEQMAAASQPGQMRMVTA